MVPERVRVSGLKFRALVLDLGYGANWGHRSSRKHIRSMPHMLSGSRDKHLGVNSEELHVLHGYP